MDTSNQAITTSLEKASAFITLALGVLGIFLIHMGYVKGGLETLLLAVALVGVAIGVQVVVGKRINRMSKIPYE
jgi:hypothetical protein